MLTKRGLKHIKLIPYSPKNTNKYHVPASDVITTSERCTDHNRVLFKLKIVLKYIPTAARLQG
jgi:hypothetical protein